MTTKVSAQMLAPGAGAPVGSGMDFFGTELPDGWLWQDGSEVSREEYANLFAVIGTTFGVGDGSTTFNLPDARGRVTAAADDMGGSAAGRLSLGSLGASGGSEGVLLTGAQSGTSAHSHTATSTPDGLTAASAGNHTHSLTFDATGNGSNLELSGETGSGGTPHNTSSAGAHTHTITGNVNTTVDNSVEADADEPHPNVQPTLVCYKIIKY